MAKYSLLKLLKAQKMAQDGLIYAPKSFKEATWLQLVEYCNGCGAAGSFFRPPETIYLTDVSSTCIIHDWCYTMGKTIEDKEEADRIFLNNMIRIFNRADTWYKCLQVRRAKKYYYAVKLFGGSAFWAGKN